MSSRVRGWAVDILVGSVIGAVAGAIVAVNVVIYSGVESGYQSSIPDVFRYNPVVGVITVAILVSAPVLGVVLARWLRRVRGAP